MLHRSVTFAAPPLYLHSMSGVFFLMLCLFFFFAATQLALQVHHECTFVCLFVLLFVGINPDKSYSASCDWEGTHTGGGNKVVYFSFFFGF